MKIAMTITIEIDADAWAAEYGIDRSEVREDVRRYVSTTLYAMPVEPTNVTVR